MMLIAFLVCSGVVLALAYRRMAPFLARVVGLENTQTTPAHTQRDGLDHEPARWSWLLPQHFSAIAAAGPIVGPILAATYFGWLPAWAWIIVGSILVGGVHDFMTLVASVRHGARSIAEVVRQHMNRRSHLLFLLFVWISLIYVIVAFADVTAGAFSQPAATAGAEAPGPAVAASSLLYLGLAVLMGWTMRRCKWSEARAQLVFLPLVFLAIVVGPWIPLDLGALVPGIPAQQAWNYVLFGYCILAAMAPMWLLMQPRGALGGYFLYVVIVAGVLGIVIGGLRGQLELAAPAIGPSNLFTTNGALPPMLPILFITIACGACSGFHAIVASGTTSKQLDRESDAKRVAYGAMLLEAFFACISLAAVMILAQPSGRPDTIFANGVALFLHHATFGLLPVPIAHMFALLCFATFIFDTLDACTRLARYVLMELLGWRGTSRAALATVLTVAGPVALASLPPAIVAGQALPLWRVFWNLFGTSNQLLAALTLLGLTMWLRRRGRVLWLTLAPAFLMLVMTQWSLGLTLTSHLNRVRTGTAASVQHVEAGVVLLLMGLAVWLIGEALLLARRSPGSPELAQPAPA
ncbi:MAG TPA: carbon starvation CstA family protein [Candidatus Synoicihabitans sp.]|nr:carbon starvation CstA family protein [Candidatus Synoicihabitans sp.]